MNHPELQSISITNRSGAILFASGSTMSRNQRQIAGLITALVDLSNRSVNAPVSYVCMNNVAITIAHSENTGIKVILFHDANFYRELARCIANSILHAFCEKFDQNDFVSTDTTNFKRFSYSVGPTIRDCSGYLIHDLVDRLNQTRGAAQYAIVFNISQITAELKYAYPSNADSITVAANLSQLQFAIQDWANIINDSFYELVVEDSELFTHIAIIGSIIVILKVRATEHSPKVISDINCTFEMVRLCAQTADCV